ncbi:MAG: hypothetical protein PHI56_06975 [Victivallaceae bacterium]|nr:hypothetical protein [Victivallaceae bacterium]
MNYSTIKCFVVALIVGNALFMSAIEQVSFDSILGAKRRDKTNKLWELALGNPLPLFPNHHFISADVEKDTVRGENHLLTLPFWPTANHDFTCALDIETENRGSITMIHRNQKGSVVQEWDEFFDGSGNVKFRCRWPQILMNGNEKFEMRVSIKCSKPITVRKIYIYQSMRQIFRLDSPSPVRGFLSRDFTADTKNTEIEPGLYDGFEAAKIIGDEYTMIRSALGTNYGLVMPVAYANGCSVVWRSFGKATVAVYADACKDETKLHRRIFEIGENGLWQQGIFTLDTSLMERCEPAYIWSGKVTSQGNIMAAVQGKGTIMDFLAFLPQNRIDLPENHKFKVIKFRYRDINGMWERASLSIPSDAKALGIVNRNPGIQLLWLRGSNWELTEVLRNFQPNTLAIREDSIVLYTNDTE